jgi:hypothetical protein
VGSGRIHAPRAALLLLVLAGLALPSTAVAGYRPPKQAIVPRDQSIARTVVLRTTDMTGTGWTSVPFPISESLVGGVANDALSGGACPGVNLDSSRFTVTGAASSPVFGAGSQFLFSTSEIAKSRGEAKAYFAGQTSGAVLRCSGELFLAGLRKGLALSGAASAKSRMLSVRRLAVNQPVDGAAAVRAVARITAGTQSTTLTVDTIALREGRAIAVVDVGSFGAPPPSGLEKTTLARLVERLRASRA